MFLRRSSFVVAFVSTLILGSASIALADPGDVDTTFGTLGHTTVDLTGNDRVTGVDRQSTGKIVVSGDNNTTGAQVLRLFPGGTPDTGFGIGGSRTLSIPGAAAFTSTDLAIQGNDRILVTGWETAATGPERFVVARFRAGGGPDPDFGSGGVKKVGFTQGDAFSYGVAVQANGRIVLVGEVDPSANVSRIAITRLRPGGALDTSFGANGRRIVPLPDTFAGFDGAWRVRVMADGRLVLAGWNQIEASNGYRTVIVRLRPDGRLDRSFSGDGIAVFNLRTNVDDWAEGLEFAGSKIVLGIGGLSSEPAALRLNGNGSRDSSFSGDGFAKFLVSGFVVGDAVVQADGKILLSDSAQGRLLRIRSVGSRDLGFGTSGVTQDPSGPDDGDAIELQGGRIILAGDSSGASAVSRFIR